MRDVPNDVTTYNFMVAEHHNYFVGAQRLWVHNCCGVGIDQLFKNANRPYNDKGLSAAARAWEKHTFRPGGTFEPLFGGVSAKNETASSFLEELLTNPGTRRTQLPRGGVEFRNSAGQGVRFDSDGTLSGFLDPKK